MKGRVGMAEATGTVRGPVGRAARGARVGREAAPLGKELGALGLGS